MIRETPNVTIAREMEMRFGIKIDPQDFGLRKSIAATKKHIADEDETFSNVTPNGTRYGMVCVNMESGWRWRKYAKFFLYKDGGRWAAEFCKVVDEG